MADYELRGGAGVLRRVTLGVAGILALSYSLLSLRAVWLALIGSARGPDMAGIFPMLALSVGAVGVVLSREAVAPRRPPPSLVPRTIRAFGQGWLVGLAATLLLTVVRLASISRGSGSAVGDVLSDIFSYAIVSLLLAIPGLAALSLSQSRATNPSSKNDHV